MKWGKAGLIGVGVAGAMAVAGAVAYLRSIDAFAAYPVSTSQECLGIDLAGSASSIALDPARGLAYLSLLDRASADFVTGTVQLLDLNRPEPAPRAAMNFDPGSFRPGALSLLRIDGEPLRLFATSRLPDGAQTVEIAAEAPAGGFSPEATVRDARFESLTAIAAAGPRQFYVASVAGDRGMYGFPARLDALRRHAPASLLYHDGRETREVARDLRYVGGLARSPDGKRLYVAETLAKMLRVYEPQRDGALVLRESIGLDGLPAGLNVDADGAVWVASYARLADLLAHAADPGKRVFTNVVRIDARGGVTDTYANAGDRLSSASSAARWQDRLVVGGLFDRKVLVCKLKP